MGGGTIHTNGFDSTFSGAASGSGVLTKAGSGSLTLSGVNTHTGGTAIDAGTLKVSASANLGAASAPLVINNATLQATDTFGDSRPITLGKASSTISVDAGKTLSIGAAVSGSGSLTKAGDGTMLLSVANTYAGATNITGGKLVVSGVSGTGYGVFNHVAEAAGYTLVYEPARPHHKCPVQRYRRALQRGQLRLDRQRVVQPRWLLPGIAARNRPAPVGVRVVRRRRICHSGE